MKLFDAFSEDNEENLQLMKEKVTKGAVNAAIFLIASIMIAYGLNNMYTIIFLSDDEAWVEAVNTATEGAAEAVEEVGETVAVSELVNLA